MSKTIVLIDKAEGHPFMRGEVEQLKAELRRLIKDNPMLLIWPDLEITQIKEIPITSDILIGDIADKKGTNLNDERP